MWYALIALIGCASLNIHIVPHTHIDAGWVVTPDRYYIEYASPILTNLMTLLCEFPDFKFVWSEAIFLKRFLSEYPKYIPWIKRFIESGRFEIVGGGWIMNDEALVDFEGVTRQMTAGHRFFKDVLGVENITVAWQLDPFGHSSLTPALFEKMGFEYLVMSRIHGDYKVTFRQDLLKNSKNMEFVWRSYGLGARQGLFTHVLYSHYDFPEFLKAQSTGKCFTEMPIKDHELDEW